MSLEIAPHRIPTQSATAPRYHHELGYVIKGLIRVAPATVYIPPPIVCANIRGVPLYAERGPEE
jgi:hypothetical protein